MVRSMAAPEPVDQVDVKASPNAVEFIEEHGGRLYVWADDSGLEHVRTEPPDHPVDFAERSCGGFDLYVDRTIAAPQRQWTIVYHHFPFQHVEAIRDTMRG